MDYTLHRVRADDWRQCRSIRLQMLEDTPLAYLETVEEALRHPESEWRFRASRSAGPGNIGVAAAGPDGTWVGTMSGFLSAPGTAKLVSVWLHPGHRGPEGGAAGLMLDEIVRWAREDNAADRLVLLVHEDNHRAIAFYRRSGFTPTGHTEPYPLDESSSEIEMELPLRPAP
ncbi:GNAT family N-acetyltransferase [Streptomyces phyllanthi]|uniref:GNAT family N-acetyltransferase n=1 Tax=Streptomyces phyllanthi TaxID=1803180 RepID=A0A5N8WDR5_9ACTN|nr:N-acetyltransferase [Streptomyces phyllanthi]MPY44295.1 GNAT family N-acetyltransferase [Streptomyces phyllanthi]